VTGGGDTTVLCVVEMATLGERVIGAAGVLTISVVVRGVVGVAAQTGVTLFPIHVVVGGGVGPGVGSADVFRLRKARYPHPISRDRRISPIHPQSRYF
jgi:hypothetical protein